MINELAQYLRKIPIKQWPNGDENRTQPEKHNPQQNKSSYTAGEKARMMRLICKIKENNRRGISNHDTKYMRRFYITVAVPQMLYTADLFLILQGEKRYEGVYQEAGKDTETYKLTCHRGNENCVGFSQYGMGLRTGDKRQ